MAAALWRALRSAYKKIVNKVPGGAQQTVLIRINELKPEEQDACAIAVRVLQPARAEAWDVDDRQGAVDVMLTLKDGRRAAFEVTNLAAPAHSKPRTSSPRPTTNGLSPVIGSGK